MAQLYPVSAIATLLKLSTRRVHQLVKDGILPRPVSGQYDAIGCVHGYVEYLKKLAAGSGELTLTDERTRLTKYQADLVEIELATSRGEVITRKTAEKIWSSIVTTTRQKLLGIPTRVAPQLVGTKSIPEAKELLENAIYEVLTELEHATLEEPGGEDDVPEGDALLPSPSEIHRQPVGRRKPKAELRK